MSQAKKEILLEVGKESMSEGGKGLSIVDKPLHNTQKAIANDLGWSTGKVAMADKAQKFNRRLEVSINAVKERNIARGW